MAIYLLDTLSVKITSEGTNWWGQHVTTDILKDYYHQDRLGSTTNLTDQFGRVVGRADYNEWGEITYREALDITSSYRRIYPQSSYTGHDYDDVLNLYFAKARFYSAEDKRFVAMDPVKGNITNPLSLVPYVYCVDNPLRWVDPLGLIAAYVGGRAVEVEYINKQLFISLEDALSAYGFNKSKTNPNAYTNEKNVFLRISDNQSRVFATSAFYRMYKVLNGRGQKERHPLLFNSSFNSNCAEKSLALSTLNGIPYVNLDYFVRFMCQLGDSRSVEYTGWVLTPQEISNTIISNELTDAQANTLLKANEHYLNHPELKDATAVFAFEGAGNINDAWGKYHPYGQFNAMMVSVDSKGNIIALTKNGSTLPDEPNKSKAVVKEGIYSLTNASHYEYAAATLNGKGEVDAYRDKGDNTATAINFHAANLSTSTRYWSVSSQKYLPCNWSAGCMVIFVNDYIDFGVKTGFLKEESLSFTYATFSKFKENFAYDTYTKKFSGKIVIDRSELYNLLVQDKETYAEELEYYFGKDWRERG